MISLKNYGSDASSSEDESDDVKETGIKTELTMHLKPVSTALIVSGDFLFKDLLAPFTLNTTNL